MEENYLLRGVARLQCEDIPLNALQDGFVDFDKPTVWPIVARIFFTIVTIARDIQDVQFQLLFHLYDYSNSDQPS